MPSICPLFACRGPLNIIGQYGLGGLPGAMSSIQAVASIVMLVALLLTLCSAFWWKKGVLALM